MRVLSVLPALLLPSLILGQGVISTIAGTGVAPTTGANGDGGLAINARLRPNGMAMDALGNIYVTDQSRQNVRKISTSGIITTVAGTGSIIFRGDGGPATEASIQLSSNHNGLAVDKEGNLYIPDFGANRVRKIDANGIIRTVAGNGTQGFGGDGGPATSAALWHPSAVAFDAQGNMFIADSTNMRVRKVTPDGIISTFAGNGQIASGGDGFPATQASINEPVSVALDALGNVYIAEYDGYKIRKVDPAGIITTVAGSGAFGYTASLDNGPATAADMSAPWAVWPDGFGNLLIADHNNNRLRKVNAAGIITTIAGNLSNNPGDGGPPSSARVTPADVVTDAQGNIYIADRGNRIRKITISERVPGISTDAGALYFSIGVGASPPAPQVVPISTAGTVPLGFTYAVSTETGGNWLNAGVNTVTPSNLTVSVGGGMAVGVYKGKVRITPIAPDLPVVEIPVTYSVVATPPTRPAITAPQITNAASFEVGVSSNTWVTIKGTNLASTTATWDNAIANGQLPTSLAGVTVTFSSRPGFISYVSPTQINVLTPQIGSSAGVVVTNNGSTSNLVNPTIKPAMPGFFLWPGNQAVATRQDYSLAVRPGTFAGATTTAAKPGDVLILWGTGFGATSPASPIGIQVPGDKTYAAATAPTITINGVPATVYGAALAPGFAGLWQIAIQVPPSLPDGDWPIVATVGTNSSAAGAVLSVRQ